MGRKKLSLTACALCLCCMLILFPVICSIVYFSTAVADRMERNAQETVSFYLEQIAGDTSATLSTLRNCIYYLMSDSSAQSLMQDPVNTPSSQRLAVEEGLNRAFFVGSQLEQSTVTGLYLISDACYFPILRSGIYAGTAARVMRVYETLGDKNSARDLYKLPEYPDYCYMIVDYFDLDNMAPLGKIIIELQVDGLADTAALNAIYQQATVLLTTAGQPLSETEDLFAQAIGAGSGYLKLGNRRYYHARQALLPTHAAIDIFIPHSEIVETSHETMKVYIFFSTVVLALTLALGVAAIYLFYKPLRQMLQKLDRLATGDLSVRMEESPYAETEGMTNAFNNMADNLEALFGEVYEQGVLLRDAEFRLLESQIRPHFIFNVLELINIRCMEAGETGICRMVTNLAQLLRVNISHKHEQTITFQEELRYVRYYLELQKERFGDSLNYSIDLEDTEILRYYLPKLTIQPLVENSIVHGLEPKRGGGTVRLSIWEEERAVCVRVSDDGVGFDVTQIDFEQTHRTELDAKHNQVAVANIARRIQLLYGKEYGLHIQSEPGNGTDITITLPADISERGKRE